MSEKSNKQHIQVPNNMNKKNGLEPKYLLVYSTLRKYMNNETKECFPSLATLSKDTGYSINTIRNSISSLASDNYISIRKDGRRNIYRFNPHKNFEPFSYKFLENKTLETNEKAYLIAHQQFMMKDQDGFGKTTFTNEQLSEKLNISARTISRLDNSLMKKGYLNIVKTDSKDPITGLHINEKFFHLDELGQAIIWTLQKHEEDIEELKEVTESNTKDLKIVLRENDNLKLEMEELKRRIYRLENGDLENNDEILL
jgi:predicted transcriptional regulator